MQRTCNTAPQANHRAILDLPNTCNLHPVLSLDTPLHYHISPQPRLLLSLFSPTLPHLSFPHLHLDSSHSSLFFSPLSSHLLTSPNLSYTNTPIFHFLSFPPLPTTACNQTPPLIPSILPPSLPPSPPPPPQIQLLLSSLPASLPPSFLPSLLASFLPSFLGILHFQ